MMRTALTGGNSTPAPSSHCCKSWGSNKLSARLSASSICVAAAVRAANSSALAALLCLLSQAATTAGHRHWDQSGLLLARSAASETT